MGWNSANEIVDPVIDQLVKGVHNEEMEPGAAKLLLVTLIKKCQDSDWDTEDETLEKYLHVPWVVEAFCACDIKPNGGERPDRDTVKHAIRQTIDSNVDSWYDLSEDFARNVHADAITDAVMALFPEDT